MSENQNLQQDVNEQTQKQQNQAKPETQIIEQPNIEQPRTEKLSEHRGAVIEKGHIGEGVEKHDILFQHDK